MMIDGLDDLVAQLRTLGVTEYRFGDLHLVLGPLSTQVVRAVPAPPASKTCACGCPPWKCNSVAPCKGGCARAQCHPPDEVSQ